MKHVIAGLLLLLPALALAQKAIAPTALPPPVSTEAQTAATPAAHAWAAEHLKGWPVERQVLAAHLVSKYGKPQEMNSRELAWYDNGPWKRTVLHRDGDLHRFPLTHRDVLWQTINYRVPVSKVAALLNYDGSILVDHTLGEVTVHCDSEEENIIILNLVNEIVTGQDTVEQALAYHAQVIEGMRIHEPEDFQLKLRFNPPKSNATTADPGDEAELLRHLAETPPAR